MGGVTAWLGRIGSGLQRVRRRRVAARRLPQVRPAPRRGGIRSRSASRREIQDGFLPVPSIATSLPYNGDPAGYRKWLGERGVVYGLEYTNDVLSNVRGGTKTGTIDQGKLHGILTVDFGKLAGWDGLTDVRQLLPDSQHRPHPPRLCRRHQHHRRDRGGADHAAFGAVA